MNFTYTFQPVDCATFPLSQDLDAPFIFFFCLSFCWGPGAFFHSLFLFCWGLGAFFIFFLFFILGALASDTFGFSFETCPGFLNFFRFSYFGGTFFGANFYMSFSGPCVEFLLF